MREVQHAVADPCRRAVGMHVAQPGDQLARWLVRDDVEFEHRRAEDFKRRVERRRVEHQRFAVVLALIAGVVGRRAVSAPGARGEAGVLRRAQFDPGFRARLGADARRREELSRNNDVRAGPRRLRHPAAGNSGNSVAGRIVSMIQARNIGSSMMPVSTPFSQWSHQRSVSRRKPIAGPGRAGRADTDAPMVRSAPCAARSARRAGAGWRWCRRPTSRRRHTPDSGSRRNPRTPSRACRTRRAAGGAARWRGRTADALQPLHPHLPPALADQCGVGRARGAGEHRRAPGEFLAQQAAAHVVDVVGVTVVCRAQRDHRPQRGAAGGPRPAAR